MLTGELKEAETLRTGEELDSGSRPSICTIIIAQGARE